jgi:hypothetical protein
MAAEAATEAAPATLEAPAEAAAAPKAPAKNGAKPDAKNGAKPDAKKGAKPDAKGNGEKKGGKDAKKKQGEEDEQASTGAPSVAAHPRAVRAVALAKGWGGLLGFLLGGYLSLPTNTLAAAGLRALVAGIVCYVVAWGGAVFLWRRLVMLELKGREQQLLAPPQAGARRGLPSPSGESPAARAS